MDSRPPFGFALRKLYRCQCHICGATFRSKRRTAKYCGPCQPEAKRALERRGYHRRKHAEHAE